MSTTRKVVIGIGIAGGALLAAWLLTGERNKKTRKFIARKAGELKRTLNKEKGSQEESEIHYV